MVVIVPEIIVVMVVVMVFNQVMVVGVMLGEQRRVVVMVFKRRVVFDFRGVVRVCLVLVRRAGNLPMRRRCARLARMLRQRMRRGFRLLRAARLCAGLYLKNRVRQIAKANKPCFFWH
jgi:hypothetical protein